MSLLVHPSLGLVLPAGAARHHCSNNILVEEACSSTSPPVVVETTATTRCSYEWPSARLSAAQPHHAAEEAPSTCRCRRPQRRRCGSTPGLHAQAAASARSPSTMTATRDARTRTLPPTRRRPWLHRPTGGTASA
jgi:hypothetical protein